MPSPSVSGKRKPLRKTGERVIVHDSIHAKLYHEYLSQHGGKVPDEVWTGHAAERICLDHHLRVLKEIGAPETEAKYFKTLTPDYADVPYQKRNW